MKRSVVITKLLNEGFTEKFLSKLTDKQVTELSSRVLSEETLNIPKDDQQGVDDAKSKNVKFVTYEEETEEEDEELDEEQSIEEWVEGVVKENYHTDTTTKKEIYEMIGALSDSPEALVNAMDYFSVDEQSPEPSKPDTDAPVREKPTTRPGKPKRENPFEPKHKPKPKAKLPKQLSFDSIGLDLKMAAE
tara:strand:+ start:2644 stop:3213 length:570 start_codon:yes stop_codon:yes gene_type:complete